MLDAAHGIDVDAPATRAPCQRQGTVLRIIRDDGLLAAIQVSRGFSQPIDRLAVAQSESGRPDGVPGRIQPHMPERRVVRRQRRHKHLVFATAQHHAQGVGTQFQADIALRDPPAVSRIERSERSFAYRLLSGQQHFRGRTRACAGTIIGQLTRLATAQPEYSGGMGLDHQMQAIACVKVDTAGAGCQQLDRVERISMNKVVLRRHRASPGFSQKPIKVVILTDLAPEINSVPVLTLATGPGKAPTSARKST